MKLNKELKPTDITVIVDTREQLPFDLTGLRRVRGTLTTGDYSVEGLTNKVAIERKGLDDLVACVGHERERFEREIMRLLAYPTRAVIVEASWADLDEGDWRAKTTPAAVVGSVIGWISMGVPFILAGGRTEADYLCKKLLFAAARKNWREVYTFLEVRLGKKD
jgi:ERCC4-type nuclease